MIHDLTYNRAFHIAIILYDNPMVEDRMVIIQKRTWWNQGASILNNDYYHPNIPRSSGWSVKQPNIYVQLLHVRSNRKYVFLYKDLFYHILRASAASQPISICIVIRSMGCSTAKSFLDYTIRKKCRFRTRGCIFLDVL